MKELFEGFKAGARVFSGFLTLSVLLTGCDSTPRERQEVAKNGARELDTLARTAAQKVANVGKATARYDATNRARRSRPLDPRQEVAMETKLLGPYSGQINALTPADLPAAYTQFVSAVRAQRDTWTDREWDYARAVYKRLNDQVKQIRMDMPARYEIAIRARQAEFVTLQAGHTAQGISEASKQREQAR